MRVLLYVVLVLLGALVGVAGALVQAMVQGGWFPGGLLLALLGVLGVCYGGVRAVEGRGGAYAAGAGWLAAAILLSFARPEGDFAYGAGLGPSVYLLGGMLAAVMCATLGAPMQPGQSSGRPAK
ncbi:DUF6113 family protein [Streptomyces sp. NPDC002851]